MRRFLIVAGILAAGASAAWQANGTRAAPGPSTPGASIDRGKARAQARAFASGLQRLVNQVSELYVRPLAPEELYTAALTGLFQAARKAPPRDLRIRVRQAIELSLALRPRSCADVVARSGQGLAWQTLMGIGIVPGSSIGALTVGGLPMVPAEVCRFSRDPREQLLVRLRERLGPVDSLAGGKDMLAACRGMLRLLDSHSGLITANEQRLTAGLDHESRGVGLEFQDHVGLGPLVIDSVPLGGPGQRAGIRPRDVITHIDGKPILEAPVQAIEALRSRRVLLLAPPLTPGDNVTPAVATEPISLRVTYRRPGEKKERTATLMPERFRPESVVGTQRRDDNTWSYLIDERQKLALLRLTSLSRGSADDLRNVLEGLREQQIRGLVLDLRWCPGGYLNEAIEVADLFLGNGVITTERSRGREDVVYRSAETGKFRDCPLVVLVNSETSGGAELIVAALQDHKRAVVIGQRTRGKGSVQVPLAIGVEEMALKLTRGAFIRPSGKNLHRFPDSSPDDDWGVLPDEDFRVSPGLSKRLAQWHLLHALRPARSNERLPLDDPTADTQRRAAVELLRKQLQRKGS